MKPRIDGLPVVAFTPKPQPKADTPPVVSDEERRKARFILDAIMQIHRLHDVDFESIVIIKGLADRLLAAAHSGPQRRPKKNLGKPVVDLTGDDREGA